MCCPKNINIHRNNKMVNIKIIGAYKSIVFLIKLPLQYSLLNVHYQGNLKSIKQDLLEKSLKV